MSVLTLQKSESIQARRERLNKQLRLEHLNNEEKKAIEETCKNCCDIFHLEDDMLTFTTAIAHEIATKVDSAPVNVRPYRVPETHKEEMNHQITKMLDDDIIRSSSSQWTSTSRSKEN